MTKKTLSYFDWTTAGKTPEVTEALLVDMKFAANASWALPQLSAFLGSELPLARNEAGKYSFSLSVTKIAEVFKSGNLLQFRDGHYVTGTELFGILRVLNFKNRKPIFPSGKTQTTKDFVRYAGNVPLILAALKEYRNIKYSSWDWEDTDKMHIFLDAKHLELVPYFGNFEHKYSLDDLLHYRDCSLTGNKKLESLASITGHGDKEFGALPYLMKPMLCQTWVYMPSIRSPYAITDLNNLDIPATPLITTEVLVPPASESNPFL